ncbi:MAG: hypothetical protein C4576_16915 [Desulfobacteraceae bacterium]|nr:MAG: hypothetical protein C4576_16915 [Desulfobacteraceae bacterium]
MRYLADHLLHQGNWKILLSIDAAAHRLHGKLENLNPGELALSDYSRRYLRKILANPVRVLQRYSYLLFLALKGCGKPFERLVLVDYGGGCGTLSFLASEAGVGRVIYNDIYDVSCCDAKRLSCALGSDVQAYVCGDIDDVISYLKEHSLSADVFVSNDVIEHVYDVRGYIGKMASLSNHALRVVHASGANKKNPLIARRFRKRQLACEHKDRLPTSGWKQMDTLRSYLGARKEIVAGHAPFLKPEEVEKLAALTRGLRVEDIEKSVDEYLQTGAISYRPDHPTNTCDPYTGSWAEHLMDTSFLEKTLHEEGFRVETLSGYWHYFKPFPIRIMGTLLNFFIMIFKRRALCVSPYYVICAEPKRLAHSPEISAG